MGCFWRLLPLRSGRKIVLLCASYFFYATWGLGFLALLIFSSLVNYGLGEYLRRQPKQSRLWMGVGFNLLVLALFKLSAGHWIGSSFSDSA